jgi:hypothetical protein
LDADIMRALLEGVRAGTVTPDAAVAAMRNLPFEELGFAKVDHHRAVRKGLPEVIFCQGKTADQVGKSRTVCTAPEARCWPRAPMPPLSKPCGSAFPSRNIVKRDGSFSHRAAKASLCRELWASSRRARRYSRAEEAAGTLEVMGATVQRIFDVGVAGLHRLLYQREGSGALRCAHCRGGNGRRLCPPS